ncbi:MAG: PAS domain-containing sensor histidine kinase [Anaerolineae bacterium]|nr:PAS domain-containing sensor histidine kinase [Anaerolineae bacterium]
MNQRPSQTNGELNAGLGEVHRFGSASESLFRRLYRGLNRRGQLEEELRRQRILAGQQAAQNESLQRRYQQLQSDHSRRASEMERLQAVLGSLDEGIITQDPNGKVTMMNQAAEAMLGGKKAFWDSALGTLFERYRDVVETRAELTPLGESDEIPLNNRIVQAQLIAVGDENRQRIGTVIILRDVTYDALAERLKDGFVRHIAEEMDKPVNVIKLAAELLSGQPEDSAVNQRLLEKLLNNVDILDQLALELRDIGRMNAGAFEVKREPLSAEGVVWSVVNGMGADIRRRGIDLLVMTRDFAGVKLRGDDTRLQWALGHLVRNGADYNQEGGYVALAARSETRNGAPFAFISVSDNGSGISPANLPHIFERFYRGAAPDASQSRLGQGLYVAKAICEAHGGFLQAESREGVGSIFTMGVPIFPADASA